MNNYYTFELSENVTRTAVSYWKAFLRKRLKNKKQGGSRKNCCHSVGKLKQYL